MRVARYLNAVAELDRTSMKSWFKNVQNIFQNIVVPKSGLQLYNGKMKIDAPTSPRGVEKTKHWVRK